MPIHNGEDKAFKIIAEKLPVLLMERFDIEGHITVPLATEHITGSLEEFKMDYLYDTEEGFIIHFEFQTTDKRDKTLSRFAVYDALLRYKTGKEVYTYVIYSNKITSVNPMLSNGFGRYSVRALCIAEQSAEKTISELNLLEYIGRDKILDVAFLPIMGGKLSMEDKIKKTLELMDRIDEKYRYDISILIWVFIDKFISDEKKIKKFLEDLRMKSVMEKVLEEINEKNEQTFKDRVIINFFKNENLSINSIAKSCECSVDYVKNVLKRMIDTEIV